MYHADDCVNILQVEFTLEIIIEDSFALYFTRGQHVLVY